LPREKRGDGRNATTEEEKKGERRTGKNRKRSALPVKATNTC